MKDKIVEIGKELYDDLNALYHTEDGTTNKYDIKMDKSGVLNFIELFADRITKFYSAGEEVYVECEGKEATHAVAPVPHTGEKWKFVKKLTRPTVSGEKVKMKITKVKKLNPSQPD